MTRDETKKLLAVLKIAYPHIYSKFTDAELSAAVNLWYAALGEFSYKFISRGLKRLVQSSKYPPTVAEVLESANLQQKCTIDLMQQPSPSLYQRDAKGNAIRGEDGHLMLSAEVLEERRLALHKKADTAVGLVGDLAEINQKRLHSY